MGYSVYVHITPNKKRYVGITCKKPEYRWNHGKGYKYNKHFFNAILKYGWENIKHIIVAENLTKAEACDLEKMLIAKYDTTNTMKGYNNSIGGESGALGVKYSQEVIENRKKNRVYKSSWAKGKHFSEEHRRKISESNKGRKMSAEARKKMSEAKKGYHPLWAGKERDDKFRASISIPVLCVETKITYFGMMEAERQTGIQHGNICRCLKGEREKAGGFHWEYAERR